MAMRRIRSRDMRSGTTNPRTTGRRSVARPALDRAAAGRNEIAPGAVQLRHLGSQAIQEPNLAPELIPRESVAFNQTGALFVDESNDYPVRFGGRPLLIVTLKVALTSAGQVQLSKNGTVFATEILPTGQTGPITFGPWPSDLSVDPTPIIFRTGNTATLAITDAGAGGEGFHAELWFS